MADDSDIIFDFSDFPELAEEDAATEASVSDVRELAPVRAITSDVRELGRGFLTPDTSSEAPRAQTIDVPDLPTFEEIQRKRDSLDGGKFIEKKVAHHEQATRVLMRMHHGNLDERLARVSQAMEEIRRVSPKSVESAAGREAFIREVVTLSDVKDDLIGRFEDLKGPFSRPYVMDPSTLKPSFNYPNIDLVQDNLSLARRKLALPFTGIPELSTGHDLVLAPDGVITKLLAEVNRNPSCFENPGKIVRLFIALRDILDGTAEATGAGIAATVVQTYRRVLVISRAVAKLRVERDVLTEYREEAGDEQLQRWHRAVHELHVTYAQAIVRAKEVYGVSAAWLMNQVDVGKLDQLHRQLCAYELRVQNRLHPNRISLSPEMVQKSFKPERTVLEPGVVRAFKDQFSPRGEPEGMSKTALISIELAKVRTFKDAIKALLNERTKKPDDTF